MIPTTPSDRQAIVRAARTQLGVPWSHIGRSDGLALDCVGLIAIVARRLGMRYYDRAEYPRIASEGTLSAQLEKTCGDPFPVEEALEGDVLGFWFMKRSVMQHVGIKTDVGIIHCYASAGPRRQGRQQRGRGGAVVEHTLDKNWRDKAMKAYRLPPITVRPQTAGVTKPIDPRVSRLAVGSNFPCRGCGG